MPMLTGLSTKDSTALQTIAVECRNKLEFRGEALYWLSRVVGFDTAWFGRVDDPIIDGTVTHAMDDAQLAPLYANYPRYLPDLTRYVRTAWERGPFVDAEHFGHQRRRMRFYDEVCRPAGSRVALTASLMYKGGMGAAISLVRTTSSRFRAPALRALQAALPMISLGDAVHALWPMAPSWMETLTAREQQVLHYVSVGLSNRQIGAVLGSSINTVRNQVASILRKAGAKNRAELVRLRFMS